MQTCRNCNAPTKRQIRRMTRKNEKWLWPRTMQRQGIKPEDMA